MTGIVTAAMIPSIIEGSLIRATPPAARMSAGTRSSAMTATAPASSAIFAWSGVTTSMMTPPLSIWARPFLVAQVEVSVMMARALRDEFASGLPADWPRGRRPFEPVRSDVSASIMARGPKPPKRRRSSPDERADDPRHHPCGAARALRREPAQRVHETEHVLVGEAVEQRDQAQDRVVGHLAQEPHGTFQLRRLEPADQADRAVEQPHEHEERRQPVTQAQQVR